ncbi:MAG: hypothetical protein PWQ29_708 [Verrucomicrobiota bacterium]|jgi:hypothetical protein|nr:hypothetical protein [Verrucomicrobiota bacterium]
MESEFPDGSAPDFIDLKIQTPVYPARFSRFLFFVYFRIFRG